MNFHDFSQLAPEGSVSSIKQDTIFRTRPWKCTLRLHLQTFEEASVLIFARRRRGFLTAGQSGAPIARGPRLCLLSIKTGFSPLPLQVDHYLFIGIG